MLLRVNRCEFGFSIKPSSAMQGTHTTRYRLPGASSAKTNHPIFLNVDSHSLLGGGTLSCMAVQTQSSIVIIHLLRIPQVPRVLRLGCQRTMSVPLPNKSEPILCLVVHGMVPRCNCQYIAQLDCHGRGQLEICSSGSP